MANPNKKKSKKKKIIFGVIALLLIVVVALVVFAGNKEEITIVQTEKVQKRNITQTVSATGKIQPDESVVITPEVTGEIVELPVEEGDLVKKGQLLIRIKPEQYIARRNSAEASFQMAKSRLAVREATLEQVKSEYERMQGLYEKDLASDSELEAAKSTYLQNKGEYEAQKAAVLQAEESYKEAQEELAKTAIYSPLNGTISQLNVELGERVLGSGFAQGTNLMTVADLGTMEAIVDVDENDVVLISMGDTAKVEVDAFKDKKFNGVVTQIGNSAITAGLGTQDEVVNFEVRIKLLELDEGIRPGMSADADIATETKTDVYAVPIQSVTLRTVNKSNGEQGKSGEEADSVKTEVNDTSQNTEARGRTEPDEVVFLVNGENVSVTKVKTGISDDTYIEITEGLTGDEDVVSGPYRAISKELNDGMRVLVRERGSEQE